MGFGSESAVCAALTLALAYMRGDPWTAMVSMPALMACFRFLRLVSAGRDVKPADVTQASAEVADIMGEISDPLFVSYVPSNGLLQGNASKQLSGSNEYCDLQVHAVHRPTHDPTKLASGQYPYSERLHGKLRNWEIRFQLKFKKVPDGELMFGLELGGYVVINRMARKVQQALNYAIGNVVGDFYHSNGDDPAKTIGEVEPPTFVMPLWAFDQFIISEAGQEPKTTDDLTDQGFVRKTMGVRRYAEEMKKMQSTFSTDKVYTFCFWGISRFLDVNRWEICGIPGLPGFRMDFNDLCGAAPVYITMYELEKKHPVTGETINEKRHLTSLKRYYLKLALWSQIAPPSPDVLRKLVGSAAASMKRKAKAVGGGGIFSRLGLACCFGY